METINYYAKLLQRLGNDDDRTVSIGEKNCFCRNTIQPLLKWQKLMNQKLNL